jgi:hypothetical protein
MSKIMRSARRVRLGILFRTSSNVLVQVVLLCCKYSVRITEDEVRQFWNAKILNFTGAAYSWCTTGYVTLGLGGMFLVCSHYMFLNLDPANSNRKANV